MNLALRNKILLLKFIKIIGYIFKLITQNESLRIGDGRVFVGGGGSCRARNLFQSYLWLRRGRLPPFLYFLWLPFGDLTLVFLFVEVYGRLDYMEKLNKNISFYSIIIEACEEV
ncbi:MAG: hypothetical protein UT80_C0049G0004 [Parcubacteria group bacterium GW2011_GWC1_40_13]|nr:MAG: hypothetical protein UT80_C0049G0004 [Parcubacteria group bacterium GW2011_GWC1_40_13]